MSSYSEVENLLAVDVGSVSTRAALFAVVEGRYRLVATASVASTTGSPLFDAREGVRSAIDEVELISGWRVMDESETLIMPASRDGTGVDAFTATFSAGPGLNAILLGLMPDVSLESARRMARSTYLHVVGEMDCGGGQRIENRVDRILAAQADVIVMAGGTDGGASASVLRMVDALRLASELMPEGARPLLLYAGNRHIAARVTEQLGQCLPLSVTANVRPSLNQEELLPARLRLSEHVCEIYSSHILGYKDLNQWSGGRLMASVDAFGRVVRYMSRVYSPHKGVLGIDLGASHTVVAAGFEGQLEICVRDDLGMGNALPGVLKQSSLAAIMRWLPIDIPARVVRNYIFNKGLHPSTVPAEMDEQHIECALARQVIRAALEGAQPDWPKGAAGPLLPPMEPILGSGGALGHAPRPAYSALVLLDALQPVGVTTLVLDPYGLASILGSAASLAPLLTVQGLSSGCFMVLGSVVSPVGRARPGHPVLHLRLERDGKDRVEGVVRYGELVVLPLRPGELGRLILRPERGFDVGFGRPGKAGALRVAGGEVGLIVDARGRPIQLPRDPAQRREANLRWLEEIGGMG